MKKTALIFLLSAAVLLGAPLRGASPYGWDAASNEALFRSLLTYLRTVQTDWVGEPAYYQVQDLVTELELSFRTRPYAWMSQVHDFCNRMESLYPPTLSHPRVGMEDRYEKIRRNILRLRDFPMHQASVTNGTEVYMPPAAQVEAFTAANKAWLQEKRKAFFAFLRGPRPSGNEIQIVKLYSSGYVFRTKEGCIGIDICYSEGLYDGEGRDELADLLDAVFVTHAHGDHYDIPLLNLMLRKGKAVVVPHTMERHLTATGGERHIWDTHHLEPVTVAGCAQTQAYMSAQGTEPCLLYLIQLGSWRMVHVGDNSIHDNEARFYPQYPQADLLLSPIFQGLPNFLKNTQSPLNPKDIDCFYLNIHENEWHHTIDGRVSYQFLYTSTSGLAHPSIAYPGTAILDCGEHITLTK